MHAPARVRNAPAAAAAAAAGAAAGCRGTERGQKCQRFIGFQRCRRRYSLERYSIKPASIAEQRRRCQKMVRFPQGKDGSYGSFRSAPWTLWFSKISMVPDRPLERILSQFRGLTLTLSLSSSELGPESLDTGPNHVFTAITFETFSSHLFRNRFSRLVSMGHLSLKISEDSEACTSGLSLSFSLFVLVVPTPTGTVPTCFNVGADDDDGDDEDDADDRRCRSRRWQRWRSR